MDDPDAFRRLYRTHYGAVCRYLSSRVETGLVEDLASETFMVAWRRRDDLPPHELPWLLNTARKCSANHRRSRDRAAALLDQIVASANEAASVEDALRQQAQRRALVEALASVGDEARDLLVLRHWEGLPPRDIATVMGVSAVTARARLSRAQRQLQRALTSALQAEDAATAVPRLAPQEGH